MTPEDYCKRYGLKPSRLKRLLAAGRVRGAVYLDNENVQIPEDALIEYAPNNGRWVNPDRLGVQDVMWYILDASSKGRCSYIDAEVVRCHQITFDHAVNLLCERGLIARDGQCDGVTRTGFGITNAGLEYLQNTQNKKSFLKTPAAQLVARVPAAISLAANAATIANAIPTSVG